MKRLVDVVGAAVGLVVAAVPMAAIAVAVRVSMGRPILFRQQRPGLDEAPFTLLKFRTMVVGDGDDADRLTSLGRFLRQTSLDELPELVNVLRGDLSLVGPRPLLTTYLDRYADEQRRRHEVRPGITGLAQVSGRNALSWDEQFRLDVWYVDHHSTTGDLRILARTVGQVLTGHGVSQPGQATREEFRGPEPD